MLSKIKLEERFVLSWTVAQKMDWSKINLELINYCICIELFWEEL